MAQVGDGGGKGKREVSFELNLVPFIDLMSVMITFLLITAVWSQVAMIKLGSSIYGKQNIEDDPLEKPPRADVPFRLDVKSSGYRIIIAKQKIQIPKVNNKYDRDGLTARLEQIKQSYPDKVDCVVTVEEQLKYDYLIQGMDLLLRAGFPAISVATGGAK